MDSKARWRQLGLLTCYVNWSVVITACFPFAICFIKKNKEIYKLDPSFFFYFFLLSDD